MEKYRIREKIRISDNKSWYYPEYRKHLFKWGTFYTWFDNIEDAYAKIEEWDKEKQDKKFKNEYHKYK